MPTTPDNDPHSDLIEAIDAESSAPSVWTSKLDKNQKERRERIHNEVTRSFRKRCIELAMTRGANRETAAQSAAIAEWLVMGERKVEYMGTLWVGNAGLPLQQLRDYVSRFTSTCEDFMRFELEKLNEEMRANFAIWVVLERASKRDESEQRLHAHLLFSMCKTAIPLFRKWRGERSRNAKLLWREIVGDVNVWVRCTPSVRVRSCRHDTHGATGAILYCLKEVGSGSFTEIEPAGAFMPLEVQSAVREQVAVVETKNPRRIRRNNYASSEDLRKFRSVTSNGEPNSIYAAACDRRRNCRLEVPAHW